MKAAELLGLKYELNGKGTDSDEVSYSGIYETGVSLKRSAVDRVCFRICGNASDTADPAVV